MLRTIGFNFSGQGYLPVIKEALPEEDRKRSLAGREMSASGHKGTLFVSLLDATNANPLLPFRTSDASTLQVNF
jgi:hypothetical protein